MQRTRVGKYEFGRVLGEGKFSKVKFARNVENGESVAIKIMDKDTLLEQNMVQQIKREISVMNLIKHPNVVQLHEVMASKKRIYIVLEFVMGGDLYNKIAQDGRLRENEARKYFQQLITAVDYCHSRGVAHRDLKPDNLLLDSYGNIKVSDFGLSALPQQVREDGLLHTACGTPNYVAPEVINDKGYDGATADVWSCGVILFVLMAGYLPFDEQNIMTLYKKICKADFKYPQWFSSSAKKLISRIFDPNPKTRITLSEILKNDWFQKDYMPPRFQEDENVGFKDIDVFSDSEECLVVETKETQPVFMNAFELISVSEVLNLGNMFEKHMGLVKQQTKFTSKHSAKEIISKIDKAAGTLGFNVKKNNYKVKLQGANIGRKGSLFAAIELYEVAPSVRMVEIRKAGGDTLEFSEFYKKLLSALEDIIWKSKASIRENT